MLKCIIFVRAKKRFQQFLDTADSSYDRAQKIGSVKRGNCEILVLAGNKNKHGHSWHS